MPIYLYRCACGNEFESVRKMDDATAKCNQCGEEAKRIPAKPSPFQWNCPRWN